MPKKIKVADCPDIVKNIHLQHKGEYPLTYKAEVFAIIGEWIAGDAPYKQVITDIYNLIEEDVFS